MLGSVNRIEQFAEGYEEYRAAQIYLSGDVAVLDFPEPRKEETPTFDEEGSRHKVIWRYRSPGPAGTDAGSDFALFGSYISDLS